MAILCKGKKIHQKITIHEKIKRTHHSASLSGVFGERGIITKTSLDGYPL